MKKTISLFLAFAIGLLSAPSASGAERTKLLFGVHPYRPSTEILSLFKPLADYLAKKLDRPVEIHISRDYQEHIDLLGHNRLDISFIGPAPYVKTIDLYGEKIFLACLEIDGKTTFQGVIAVPKNSPIQSLGEIAGKTFAFSDRASTMGHLVPRYMLLQEGIGVEKLKNHSFLKNHNDVALALLAGEFDAGSLKQEVFDKYKDRGLRLLALTPPITTQVFVARTDMPPAESESLRRALLDLNDDAAGKNILKKIAPDITGLASVKDGDYDYLRKVLRLLAEMDVHP